MLKSFDAWNFIILSCLIAPSYEFSSSYFSLKLKTKKHNNFHILPLHASTTNSDKENISALENDLHKELEQAVKNSVDLYSRKASSLQSELRKAKDHEKMLHRANLITANLYQIPTVNIPSTITVIDWENDNKEIELSLDVQKYGTAQEEADVLYEKARKLKRSTRVIEELMLKNEKAMNVFKTTMKKLQNITDENQTIFYIRDDLLQEVKSKSLKFSLLNKTDDGCSKEKKTSSTKSHNSNKSHQKKPSKKISKSNFRTFISPSTGHKILIGKNRNQNEKICFQVAKSNDLWLHARGAPGAHVLICGTHNARIDTNDPNYPITQECLQYAADLAAFYSEARREVKTLITVAQPKHILKPRNAPPGSVKLRKELRTIIGNPFNVPDDLKEKRGDDGVENWSPIL